jgi:hypothetical protein
MEQYWSWIGLGIFLAVGLLLLATAPIIDRPRNAPTTVIAARP